MVNNSEEKTIKLNWKDFLKHPLVVALLVALISIPLTAWITYHYAVKSIDYEKNLEENLIVGFIDGNEFNATKDTFYSYDKISIENPSGKQINVKQLTYNPLLIEWFDNNLKPNETQKVQQDIPPLKNTDFQKKFEPFMSLSAGQISQMDGYFYLRTPSKQGTYYLKVCALTYSNKEFCAKDYLILHVN